MAENIVISRLELYQLVWSKPVVKIAREFGISDVAVAKICKKLNIPKPGLGYWAKKQAGKRTRQTPLPKLKAGDPATYTIKGSMDANLNLTSELIEKQKDYEARESNKITVKKTLRNPHPLIEQTLHRRKGRNSTSYYEWEKLPAGVNISVSEESYSRAIRIMDALIKALEKRGHVVTATSGYRGYTAVTIEGEELKFDIFEFSKKIPNPKKSERLYASETILEPAGRLSLRIQNYFDGQKTISDGKVKKIEDRLNEFIVILVKASEAERIRRKKREQWEKERQARAQKERDIAEARQREQQMQDQLFENAESWHKCQMVRQYIDVIKQNADDAWVEWANKKVDNMESILRHPEK